jgi:hypothetical protein
MILRVTTHLTELYACVRASRENSNSSWAEMELNIIGHFEIYPINLQTQQIFILRLLTPLAEYQASLLQLICYTVQLPIRKPLIR